MHVGRGLAERQPGVAAKRARQVGVAAVVILGPAEEELRVGVAARADDIVNAAAG